MAAIASSWRPTQARADARQNAHATKVNSSCCTPE